MSTFDIPIYRTDWRNQIVKPRYDTCPPIGLRPKYVADSLRITEILEAVLRYNMAGMRVPKAWLAELVGLIEGEY